MTQPAAPGVLAVAAHDPLRAAERWLVPVYLALVWTLVPDSAFGPIPSPIALGGIALLALAVWRAPLRPGLARAVALASALLALPLMTGWAYSPLALGIPADALREVAFVAIAALGLASAGDCDRAMRALAVAGLLLGLGALYSVLVSPTTLFPLELDEFGVEAPRAVGPFGEANFFALSLAALLPMQYFTALRGGGWRIAGIGGMITVLGAIVATGSRGGLIAAAVGLFLSALLGGSLGASGRRLRIAALAALAGAALLLPLLSAQLGSSTERTVSGRATENRIALAMFEDHPFAGVGPGGYPVLYRDYARGIGTDPRALREPHNLYLQILAEQGVAGALGWLGAAIVIAGAAVRRRIWRSATGQAVLISTATFLVGSIFLHGSILRLLFILVGMTLALAFADEADRRAAR